MMVDSQPASKKINLDGWIAALGVVAILILGVQIYFWVSTVSLLGSSAKHAPKQSSEKVEILKKAGDSFAQVVAESKDRKKTKEGIRERNSVEESAFVRAGGDPNEEGFAKSRAEAIARFEAIPKDPKWEKSLRSVGSYFVSNGSKVEKTLSIALAAGDLGKSGDPVAQEAKSFAFGVLLENPIESIRSVHRATAHLDRTPEAINYRATLLELTHLLIQTPGIEDPEMKSLVSEIMQRIENNSNETSN